METNVDEPAVERVSPLQRTSCPALVDTSAMTRGNQVRWRAHRVPVAPFVLTLLARQRDIDRARAQKRNATGTTQHDKDGLTPAQRRERCA